MWAKAAHHRIGQLDGRHAQHVMDVVVRLSNSSGFRVLDVPGCFQRLDLSRYRLVHLRHQDLLGIGVVGRDAGHHVGDDHAGAAGRPARYSMAKSPPHDCP